MLLVTYERSWQLDLRVHTLSIKDELHLIRKIGYHDVKWIHLYRDRSR